MTIQLRPDQFQLKFDIYAGWNSGAHNVFAVLPTGGGKSIIMSDIVNDKNQLGAQQVVIAHRTELVSQMSLHVARRGIKHRIIGPTNVVSQIIREHREEFNGFSYINPSAPCSVAGIDTINARAEELKGWAAQIDYWYGDEGHHFLLENKWGRGVAMFERARGLLVSASPTRADGKGLGRHADGIADMMVCGPDMRTLIDLGALCPYEIALPENDFYIDDNDLPPSGDFTPKKMREASKRSHIVGDTVQNYIKFAYGKRGICFATDVETAGEIAQRFNDAGIPAAAVSANTPADVRSEYIKRFRRGQLWMLVNVDLFGEGFDVPAVEVVIMARPTASLAVYLQQFGRALRPLPGKAFGLIIDQVSNWKRHGYPDKAHFWTLDRREKRGKRLRDPEELEMTTCRNTRCGRPYLKFLPACPICGHVPEVTPAQRRSIEQLDGNLLLLDRDEIARRQQATQLESPMSLGQRVNDAAGGAAGAHNVNTQIAKIQAQTRLKDAIAQWAGIQRHLGRSDEESYKRFYHAVGIDVLGALSADRSRQDYEKLAETIEGWYSK